VEIQATPHTELAQTQNVQEQRPQQEGAAGESQVFAPEKNKLGVFAKILAGLTAKGQQNTGVGKTGSGAEAQEKLPLADAAAKKAKGARGSEVALAEKIKTRKLPEDGGNEPELSLELSGQEKSLFALGRLTGQAEELDAGEAKAMPDSEGLTADLRRIGRESARAETASIQPDQAAAAQNGEKQSETLSTTAFAAEKSAQDAANGSERTKNRGNSAEISARTGSTAQEAAIANLQAEAKKAVPVEKDGPTRLEEARSRRRGAAFEVRDFRSGNQAAVAQQNGYVPVQAGFETRSPGESGSKDIIMELRLPNQGQGASAATTSWETRASQSLENMLARELHQNFNNDIVRHASVALRDGNEGTIRLALKPESLGNVKIHLELAENKIIGHIVVESKEALRAFEREISSLEKAFRDSGFEAASLEMSLAADGSGAENQWQEAEASRFLTEQFAASRYDAAIEQAEMPPALDIYQEGTMAVNMLA
jgi:flagellar hook-length control protein FliK